MTGFKSDEDFDAFSRKFLSIIERSNQIFDRFEMTLKRHPRFIMEKRKEDFFREVEKVFEKDTSWTPSDASLACDLIARQVAYYAKSTNGPSRFRVKRAAYYEAEDHDEVSGLKDQANEILASLPEVRNEIEKWASEFGN